jgi:D-lactate dehydrogenase (cytochrome)
MEAEFCSRDEDAVLESWTNFLSASGALHEETWFALDDRRHAELRAFRHALPSAVYERVSNSGTTKIGTDIAVPPSAFRSFYNFYVDKFRENNVEYVLFGHIGDCHVHANIFAHDTASHERMLRIYDECIAEGLRLGGTVSAEHGIGKLKKRYLKAMLGPEGIEQMRAVKAVLDPQGILSPGNMFD